MTKAISDSNTPLHILMLIFLPLEIEVCHECNLQCTLVFPPEPLLQKMHIAFPLFVLLYNLHKKESTGPLYSTGVAPSTKESCLFFVFGSVSVVSGDKVLRQEARAYH